MCIDREVVIFYLQHQEQWKSARTEARVKFVNSTFDNNLLYLLLLGVHGKH